MSHKRNIININFFGEEFNTLKLVLAVCQSLQTMSDSETQAEVEADASPQPSAQELSRDEVRALIAASS